MEGHITGVFLAIVGSMLVPIVPMSLLETLDTIPGRFVLLGVPVILYHLVNPIVAVMAGVVSGIILDRVHDLAPSQNKNNFADKNSNTQMREKDTVIEDLAPDFTKIKHDQIVMLEPPAKRMGYQ